ncbi:plastocyanin/azurin family copper-binding protein [Streptomyces sp. NPDC051776]|uniref:cupredoxin domain-containing protein n=1 Tax=Streptomyces sp. NPDC051776 TaxID=3155414 RepID=UPI003412D9D9
MARMVKIGRGAALGVAGGVLAGVLVACGGGGYGGGGGSDTTSPSSGNGDKTATRVNVDMKDFTLALSKKTFTAGDYTFVAKNSGTHEHALEVEGPGGEQKTKTLMPGQTADLNMTLKKGTYKVYCPVDSHADLGMRTQITVGDSGGSGTSGGGVGY